MSRWYEHPCTNKLLDGDQVLTVLSFINEAKESFKKVYGDPNGKDCPLDSILKLWPDKSSIKREWLRRVLDNGPMNDKIQSMGSVVCEFPMHSLFYLDSLISLVNMNKKRMAIISSDLLANVFVTNLLPKTRPLININERPLSTLIDMNNKKKNQHKTEKISHREKILAYWYFEEQLKVRYTRFLGALEELMQHEQDKVNKIKIINLCYLLSKTKENQSAIIDTLVNKLGDLGKKVAGSAFSKLQKIGQNNMALLPKIVRSVRKFVFRPNLRKKAQYYAIQLLANSQIPKSKGGVQLTDITANPIKVEGEEDGEEENEDESITSEGVAAEMVQIYIGLFKRLSESDKARCETLYAALLCGLSRALPFVKSTDIGKHSDAVFKLVHSSNLNLATRGLKVLLTVVTAQKKAGSTDADGEDRLDRYMRLLYSTVLNPAALFHSQKVALVDIFCRSLAIDTDAARVKAMLKRLLQLCLVHPEPGFVCVCLLFVSRLATTGSKHRPIFADASLASTAAIASSLPDSLKMSMPTLGGGEEVHSDDSSDSSDDEEAVTDVSGIKEEGTEDAKAKISSWSHYSNMKKAKQSQVKQEQTTDGTKQRSTAYDPLSRNPKYANAEKERFVELEMLTNHFHPSVKIFAGHILKLERIKYDSDPSVDLSLTSFLDKFAYKQPKKSTANVPAIKSIVKKPVDETHRIAVNTKEFADLSESRVPIDQRFFHQYFNHAKSTERRRNKNDDEEEEIDDDFNDSDTEFDAFLMRENADNEDELNMSGSEMSMSDDEEDSLADLDEDDLSADDMEMDMEEGDEDIIVEENDDDVEEDDDSMEGGDLDANSMEEAEEEDEEDDDEDEEEEETIHSSKRRRLGEELSTVTTGALTMGRTFERIKDRATDRIKHDRKKRKTAKNRGANKKVNTNGNSNNKGGRSKTNKVKLGKRKMKK